ncbi:hypothetical protein GCM10009733_008000 [Nonomuraea maheshkhaliensis]|uniref:Uncharacterized protein n=1 Tax=Nonomuraea maheshkhaliensis TaxID=419590 RepID=A0ABN2EQ48_9ACTN
MASVESPEGRTGRPEIDQWLDHADAQQPALAELVTVTAHEPLAPGPFRAEPRRALGVT